MPVFTEKLEHGDRREAFRLASNMIFVVTPRARRDHGAVHPGRAAGDPAVRAGLRRGDHRPHREPLADPVPDPDPARGDRDGGRRPQQLRPLRSLRDRARSSGTSRSSSCSSGSRRRSRRATRSTPMRSASSSAPLLQLVILLYDLRNTPVRDPAGAAGPVHRPHRRGPARRRRAEGPGADAPGDDQPRPDQLQPADQQHRPASWSPSRRRPRSTRRSGSTCCPQGIFSVAVATVLFPTLARFAARGDLDRLRSTMASGMRLILLLLIPATAAILVLAEPMIRVVYERGDFDAAADRPRLRGALLVRVLAAVQRHLPAADAHLLQPPATLGADRRSPPPTWRSQRPRRSRCTSRSGSAASSPRPRSRPPQASSPRR